MLHIAFVSLILFAVPSIALSPQIEVSGRAYSDSNCGYYTSSSADFQITFSSFTGAKPKVVYSFSGEKQGRAVARVAGGETPMKIRSDGTAFGEFSSRVDERSAFFYKNLKLRVVWESTDGQIRKTDEFSVNVPTRQCQPGDFEELEVL
jgi:hypothetical protein